MTVKSASGFDEFLDSSHADGEGMSADDDANYLTDFVILGSTIAVTAPLMGLVARSLVWPPIKAFYRKWKHQLSQQRLQRRKKQKLAALHQQHSQSSSGGGGDGSSSSGRPRAGSRDTRGDRRRDKQAQAQRRREEREAAQAKAEQERRQREAKKLQLRQQKEQRRREQEELRRAQALENGEDAAAAERERLRRIEQTRRKLEEEEAGLRKKREEEKLREAARLEKQRKKAESDALAAKAAATRAEAGKTSHKHPEPTKQKPQRRQQVHSQDHTNNVHTNQLNHTNSSQSYSTNRNAHAGGSPGLKRVSSGASKVVDTVTSKQGKYKDSNRKHNSSSVRSNNQSSSSSRHQSKSTSADSNAKQPLHRNGKADSTSASAASKQGGSNSSAAQRAKASSSTGSGRTFTHSSSTSKTKGSSSQDAKSSSVVPGTVNSAARRNPSSRSSNAKVSSQQSSSTRRGANEDRSSASTDQQRLLELQYEEVERRRWGEIPLSTIVILPLMTWQYMNVWKHPTADARPQTSSQGSKSGAHDHGQQWRRGESTANKAKSPSVNILGSSSAMNTLGSRSRPLPHMVHHMSGSSTSPAMSTVTAPSTAGVSRSRGSSAGSGSALLGVVGVRSDTQGESLKSGSGSGPAISGPSTASLGLGGAPGASDKFAHHVDPNSYAQRHFLPPLSDQSLNASHQASGDRAEDNASPSPSAFLPAFLQGDGPSASFTNPGFAADSHVPGSPQSTSEAWDVGIEQQLLGSDFSMHLDMDEPMDGRSSSGATFLF